MMKITYSDVGIGDLVTYFILGDNPDEVTYSVNTWLVLEKKVVKQKRLGYEECILRCLDPKTMQEEMWVGLPESFIIRAAKRNR